MNHEPRLGRPPKGDKAMGGPITIRLPPAMDAEIERIRATRLDAPGKADVIRALIAAGLKVTK